MSMNLTEEEFAKHLGTAFQISLSDRDVTLRLVEVKSYVPKENEQGGMERFSVFFDGPGEIRLPQQTFRMHHERMGEFDLFLVPVSGDASGFRYEAVFNYYK